MMAGMSILLAVIYVTESVYLGFHTNIVRIVPIVLYVKRLYLIAN